MTSEGIIERKSSILPPIGTRAMILGVEDVLFTYIGIFGGYYCFVPDTECKLALSCDESCRKKYGLSENTIAFNKFPVLVFHTIESTVCQVIDTLSQVKERDKRVICRETTSFSPQHYHISSIEEYKNEVIINIIPKNKQYDNETNKDRDNAL